MRSRSPCLDIEMLLARVKRITELRGAALVAALGLPASRVTALEDGRPATLAEQRRLVELLRLHGGTIDGLTR